MATPDQPTPHVFISYSRRDSEFVQRLIGDLQAAGIEVWIDKRELTPGTPDWEQALRDAIRGAKALLLVASPESRKSVYVKDELRIADMYRRPVYPVWAIGEEYIDCVPIGMGGSQYINAKGERYAEALTTIITALQDVESSPFATGETPSAPESTPEPPPEFTPRNPYKGLNAFTAADARDFFGREKLVKALVKALDENPVGRLLAVVGASGSGKSSVVMAGVLPTLQARDDGAVYLDRIVPGDHPLESLAVALANRLPGGNVISILRELKNPDEGTRALHLLARQMGTRVYLFVDQFEELFTLTTDETERQRFIDLLMAAVEEPRAPVTVILTLRADFYDRPLLYPELGRLIERRSHAVLPLELDELRSAIEQPAAQPDVRLTFEGDLVGDLLFEVRGQAGALPLLQFTLDQLFQRRSGRTLTQAAYRDIGGVRGALAKHAESTYEQLPTDNHRRLARALFLRLIEPGATEQDTTRRRAALSELTLPDADETQILRATADAFIAARLLTTEGESSPRSQGEGQGARATIQVSHEALIREWERLRDWLHDAREDILLQKKISADTAAWVADGRLPDYGALYSGRVLREARSWSQRHLPSVDEVAFLDAGAAREAQIEALEESRKRELIKAAERAEKSRRESLAAAQRARITLLSLFVVGVIGVIGFFVANFEYVASIERANATLTDVAGQVAIAQADMGTQAALSLQSQYAQSTYVALSVTEFVKGTQAAGNIATLQADAATAQAKATYDAALYNEILNDSETQAYLAEQSQLTVTAVAPTLTAVAEQVQQGQNQVESLRLASEASGVLLQETGNPEVAALLAIRGLNTAYTEQADAQLVKAVDRLYTRQVFVGHTGAVTSVAFSPDGAQIVTGSEDGTARVWDAATGDTVRMLQGHTDWVTSVAFSPDGTQIVTGSEDGTARLWDAATGDTVCVLEADDRIHSVAFSPDGTQIVTGSEDGTARLWDAATGEVVRLLEGHSNRVTSVAFSPDGTQIVSGSDDGTARIWDAATGDTVRVLEVEMATILSVAFSPDGKWIITGCDGRSTQVWDAAAGEAVHTLEGHTNGVTGAAFSPDSQWIVTSSYDGTARVWNTVTGETARILTGHTNVAAAAAFSPDGMQIVTGSWDGTARIWDAATPFAPKVGGGVVRLLRDARGVVSSAAFSPDGTQIVTASLYGAARIWDAATGEALRTLEGHASGVLSAAFSPDGRWIVTTSYDGTARVWGAATGDPVRILEGHTDAVLSAAFSPDGRWIVTGSSDRTARVWEAATGKVRLALMSSDDSVSVAFSPDGVWIATGSSDGTTRLWEANTGEMIREYVAMYSPVNDVAFSPDGRWLLTAQFDGSIRQWDVRTGDNPNTFLGHYSPVRSVAFSPDGSTFASSDQNGKVILWDFDGNGLARTLIGHSDSVTDVNFSPDGKWVITASLDGTVRLWEADYHEFIAYACTRVFRDFTEDERDRYFSFIHDDAPTCPPDH